MKFLNKVPIKVLHNHQIALSRTSMHHQVAHTYMSMQPLHMNTDEFKFLPSFNI